MADRLKGKVAFCTASGAGSPSSASSRMRRDSATCPGQDGFYQTGCAPDHRFVDNGDGTVTDNCTGLMWQKDTADVNVDGLRRIDTN